MSKENTYNPKGKIKIAMVTPPPMKFGPRQCPDCDEYYNLAPHVCNPSYKDLLDRLSKSEAIVNGCISTISNLQEKLREAEKKSEQCLELQEELYKQTWGVELDRLREFAHSVIKEHCWGIALDGFEIQELAEKLGLIAEHIATESDIDEESDYEVGDKIYKFTQALTKESEKEV